MQGAVPLDGVQLHQLPPHLGQEREDEVLDAAAGGAPGGVLVLEQGAMRVRARREGVGWGLGVAHHQPRLP